MGDGFRLVNQTRREVITYSHQPASKTRELAGNPVTAAVTTWYIIQCCGDHIAFVSDTRGEWPFPTGNADDLTEYTEVTDRVVTGLIGAEILRDDGIAWADPEEPETVYEKALTNIWRRMAPTDRTS